MATADYPSPVLVASTTGTGLQPAILGRERSSSRRTCRRSSRFTSRRRRRSSSRLPAKLSTTDPATLVYPVTFGTSVTTSDFVDLIGGARMFYQFNVTANTGTVVIMALAGSTAPGVLAMPQLVRMSTNATLGL